MALVAMERPMNFGEEAVRDSKSRVLDFIRPPLYPEDCILGQYEETHTACWLNDGKRRGSPSIEKRQTDVVGVVGQVSLCRS